MERKLFYNSIIVPSPPPSPGVGHDVSLSLAPPPLLLLHACPFSSLPRPLPPHQGDPSSTLRWGKLSVPSQKAQKSTGNTGPKPRFSSHQSIWLSFRWYSTARASLSDVQILKPRSKFKIFKMAKKHFHICKCIYAAKSYKIIPI